MRTMNLLGLAVIVATVPTAATAVAITAVSAPDLPTSGPATFDIAGVRLDMTPAEVRQALTAAGYSITGTTQLQSFRERVSARVDELMKKSHPRKEDAVAGIDAMGSATERIGVEFRQWPDGPHVVRVIFRGNPDRQPQDAFKGQVETKYGRPTIFNLGNWRWCTSHDRACQPMSNATFPTLDADYQSRALTLEIGGDALDARKALVEAEARRIVPLSNGSAF